MMKISVRKLILTALFTALTCVATMVIQVPSPMGGYVNLGDAPVLLSGWLFGPFWGFFAGGVGSMLADLFTGYTHYAAGTLLIKGAMAALASGMFSLLCKHKRVGRALSGLSSEVVMVLGYFFYAWLILGKGLAAASSIPGNVVQGLVGLVAALLLAEPIKKLAERFDK